VKPLLPLFLSSLAFAAPVINTGGIVNAASYVPLAIPSSGIAQGSFFVIFGDGLGPANIAVAPNLNFTTALAGTTVTVTPAAGPAVQCYLYYTVDRQVSAILPSTIRTGPATVSVSYNRENSEPVAITVVRSDFGIFTSNQRGSGPAAILNFGGSNAGLNSLSNPATDNQILVLYGTGLGPIVGADNAPPGAVSPPDITVRVLVWNQSVSPQFAGRAPEFPGEDQINFQLPPNVPDGCFIPIAIQVNDIVSNYATFAKTANGGRCTTELPATALQRLDSSGSIIIGQLSLARAALSASLFGLNLNVTTDLAGGVFTALDRASLYDVNLTPGAIPPLTPNGTCFVQTFPSVTPPTSTVPPVAATLDAGPLTLSGPNSKTQTLAYTSGTGYLKGLAQAGAIPGLPIPGLLSVPPGSPQSYIEPGLWTIKGNGGPDIGPFAASITVPTPVTCANCDKFATIDRSKPLKIDWTGGGDKDYVQVLGTATTPLFADPTQNIAVAFSCSAKASDGTLTIPPAILAQLPASSDNVFSSNTGAFVFIHGLGFGNAAFTAPLTAGGNLDLGYFGSASVLLRVVGFD
jgi:uncharacterized protein (TIGR03437 family)